MDDVKVCSKCGSEDVYFSAWVNYNNTIEHDTVGHEHLSDWCFDCKEETTVIDQEEWTDKHKPIYSKDQIDKAFWKSTKGSSLGVEYIDTTKFFELLKEYDNAE